MGEAAGQPRKDQIELPVDLVGPTRLGRSPCGAGARPRC
jgi:hypothetical protein